MIKKSTSIFIITALACALLPMNIFAEEKMDPTESMFKGKADGKQYHTAMGAFFGGVGAGLVGSGGAVIAGSEGDGILFGGFLCTTIAIVVTARLSPNDEQRINTSCALVGGLCATFAIYTVAMFPGNMTFPINMWKNQGTKVSLTIRF